jgi:membrane-bound lytic murein transglycosylase F
LAWSFPNDVDPKLLQRSEAFFARIQKDGTLNDLLDRFYGHSDRLGISDSAAFIERFQSVFPTYRPLFEEAALLTGMDWRLIAAIAYQESQWDPLATSFTNVRGMMMLTEATADRMNVHNRLDAGESIRAGAKYLQLIKDQLPQRIAEPDKTWMALAAYNQGYGHLEDARVLTKRNGGDPDSWNDVKRWMPLLNRPEYYETLKYGYARGGEAVILVENIRSFYDILLKLEPPSAAVDESQPTSYKLLEPIKKLLRR